MFRKLVACWTCWNICLGRYICEKTRFSEHGFKISGENYRCLHVALPVTVILKCQTCHYESNHCYSRAGFVRRGLGAPFSRRGSVPAAEDDWTPGILQLNTEGLIENKISVIEQLTYKNKTAEMLPKTHDPTYSSWTPRGLLQTRYLSLSITFKDKAFIIVLQETRCTTADKLVIPSFSLAGSVLSRNHGLATFVHERLEWLLVDQSPEQSETEWLCVDVAGTRSLMSTNLHACDSHQTAIPTFPHPSLYVGDFNCQHVN